LAKHFGMNAGFASDPLDISGVLRASPSNGFGKKGLRERLTECRIDCPLFADAKTTSQIATGKVKQMRRSNTCFFTVFDPVPITPCNHSGTAKGGVSTTART
jgi:hypothetical protein